MNGTTSLRGTRSERPGPPGSAHAAVLPALLALLGIVADWDLGLSLAVIWFAHIAFDRTVGYGLKYSLAKNDRHLDRI